MREISVEEEVQSSRVFRFEDMPSRVGPNGTVSRNVFRDMLVTGEAIGVHESMQPAGTVAPALHVILHSELICVREGTVEFAHDGKTERASAGDILFVARGTNHRVKNVGEGQASYFVVGIGGDAAGGKV